MRLVGSQADIDLPDGLSDDFPVQPSLQKYSASRAPPNQNYIHRRPGPQRGVSRTSQTLGRDAVDAAARLTSDAASGRRSRVVLTPRRWCQVGGGNSADDGGKKARSPGRARRKPLKPLRGECRAFSGVTVVTNARVYYTPRAAAGASGARHSLRPLIGG